MADVTKCRNITCMKRGSCYRYTARPSQKQSYFIENPSPDEKGECEYFWNNEGYNIEWAEVEMAILSPKTSTDF